MAWLLDTNVLSELRRPRPEPRVVAFIGGCPLDQLYVSAVTLAEIRFGIECERAQSPRCDSHSPGHTVGNDCDKVRRSSILGTHRRAHCDCAPVSEAATLDVRCAALLGALQPIIKPADGIARGEAAGFRSILQAARELPGRMPIMSF